MDNEHTSESQQKQTERAADSLLKKPETETAQANPGDVAKAAAGIEAGLGQEGTLKHSGPMSETDETHRAMDVLNDDTLDDTVDADGKNRDATADESLLAHNPDAFVGVNASLVNAVAEQGDGLGGFDSRPARSSVALALAWWTRAWSRPLWRRSNASMNLSSAMVAAVRCAAADTTRSTTFTHPV